MSKKEKSIFVLAEDFKAMIAMVPKLEAFLKVHNEIAEGYQNYRKNGGDAISGVEKHLKLKEQKSDSSKAKKTGTIPEAGKKVRSTEPKMEKKKTKK